MGESTRCYHDGVAIARGVVGRRAGNHCRRIHTIYEHAPSTDLRLSHSCLPRSLTTRRPTFTCATSMVPSGRGTGASKISCDPRQSRRGLRSLSTLWKRSARGRRTTGAPRGLSGPMNEKLRQSGYRTEFPVHTPNYAPNTIPRVDPQD